MPAVGSYLYGFTHRGFEPGPDLRGLAGAPVRALPFGDLAAVVSPHPVKPLMPLRSNLEPHHRVVRHVSDHAALVPAAFGHIVESDTDILGVLRANYGDISDALARLSGKSEMGLKLSWTVPNIFEHMVRLDRALRAVRDQVFRGGRQPSLNERLEVGAAFEAALGRERDRLSRILLAALDAVTCDVASTPAKSETVVYQGALLVDRARVQEFATRLHAAAGLFDATLTLDYSGPWPPYSFVRLRLQPAQPVAAA
jgi:Gas vesicle synthesis protein GvpL/GvpF